MQDSDNKICLSLCQVRCVSTELGPGSAVERHEKPKKLLNPIILTCKEHEYANVMFCESLILMALAKAVDAIYR